MPGLYQINESTEKFCIISKRFFFCKRIQNIPYRRAHKHFCVIEQVFQICLAETRKQLSYANICKNRNRLRMFYMAVWNHILPPDYAYQHSLWSSNSWCFIDSTVVWSNLNVSVFTLPYVWPHINRKPSMAFPTNAQALPYDMEYHTVNNEEHPWSRLRWLAGAGCLRKGQQIKWALVLS